MKRALIALGLVLCLGVSAPLAGAADSFGLGANLNENLTAWLKDSGVAFFEFPVFSSASEYDVAVVFEPARARGVPSLLSGIEDVNFDNGYKGFQAVQVEDVIAKYTATDSKNDVIRAELQYYLLYGNKVVEYEWDGKLLNVVPGSLFVHITVYKNDNFFAEQDLIFTPKGTFSTPIPAAALLLGSGLAGIAALRRKMA